jgi:hypothetical protein
MRVRGNRPKKDRNAVPEGIELGSIGTQRARQGSEVIEGTIRRFFNGLHVEIERMRAIVIGFLARGLKRRRKGTL